VRVHIKCPANGSNINVSPGGKICISGTVHGEGGLEDEHLFGDNGYYVLIAVYSCMQGSGPAVCPVAPSTPPSTGTAVYINGTAWCATGVPVPSSSSAGDLMVVFAWIMFPTSSGAVAVSVPIGTEFNASQGNPAASDCCSSGPCAGSGTTTTLQLISELRTWPVLLVTVPDGPYTGLYNAVPVAFLKWSICFAGEEFILAYCPTVGMVIRGPLVTIPADSFEVEPFAAIFCGGIFGAAGEVVVTVA
jgi:hypothetical protein